MSMITLRLTLITLEEAILTPLSYLDNGAIMMKTVLVETTTMVMDSQMLLNQSIKQKSTSLVTLLQPMGLAAITMCSLIRMTLF